MVMNKIHWIAATGMIFLGFVGCTDRSIDGPGGDPPGGVTNEIESMQYFALQDEFVQNTDQTFSDVSLEPDDEGPLRAEVDGEEIIPVAWGRFVESTTVTATTTIEDGDSLALVQIDRDIVGTFRILAKQSEDDTTVFLVEKPFSDHAMRNVVFRRVGREIRNFWLNWIPVATSLVAGGTVNPPVDQEIELTELQFIKPDGEDLVITDPLSFFLRYRWRFLPHDGSQADVPELSTGDNFTVRATIVSSSPDTDLVALRYGFSHIAHHRKAMILVSETDNGDGTFTRVYERTTEVRHHPGFFHAGVLAATRKTLFDDGQENYSVSWWGVPYRVQ